jgi:hypothetical protein
MPALTCFWPRLEDHLVLHLDGLVWKRGLPSSSLASSEVLMLPEARRIFHSFVVHSEVPKYFAVDRCLGWRSSCPPWSLEEKSEGSSSVSLTSPSSSEVV